VPLPSLSAAVDAKQQEADKKSRKRRKDIEDGLQMRQDIADMSKNYDWGGVPFDDCKKQRNDMVRVSCWASMPVQHELGEDRSRKVARGLCAGRTGQFTGPTDKCQHGCAGLCRGQRNSTDSIPQMSAR
jgi:hypothetical protein